MLRAKGHGCFNVKSRFQVAVLRNLSAVLLSVGILSLLTGIAPAGQESPSLAETLQWLTGASEAESSNGNFQYTFESDATAPCSVTITETRVRAGPDFWIKMELSLSDLDPKDIQVINGQEKYGGTLPSAIVGLHTRNYTQSITHTSSKIPQPFKASEYLVFTSAEFAPKFAKALKHAVALCGGRRSSY
jgi:hypothetical protein